MAVPRTAQERLLIGLDEAAALDPARVGSKAAGLARARRAGLPVPPTLVVPVADAAEARGGVGADLAGELARAWSELADGRGLAVRSSAVAEDLAGGSFAGQYESFLAVGGGSALARAVAACRASADGAAVRSYLAEKGLPPEAGGMAVILQPTLAAAAAGVAFSRNPLQPERDEVMIEAVAGLGDRLLAGAVSPYRAALGPDGEPRIERPSTAGDGEEPPLDDDGWRAVAALARRAEAAAGVPQDVEWTLDEGGRLWLLQCRPITSLRTPAAPSDVPPGTWTRALAVDLWADRLTPFLARVMLDGAERWDLTAEAERLGVAPARPTLAVVGGYLYVNAEDLRAALSALPRRLRWPQLAELFPPGTDLAGLPSPGPGRLLAFIVRALLIGLAQPQSNPLLCPGISRRRMRRLAREVASESAGLAQATPRAAPAPGEAPASEAAPAPRRPGDPAAALARVRRAVDLLVRHQVGNRWGYTWATVLTWAFRHLAAGEEEPGGGAFLQLLGEGADNVTLVIEREVRRLAARVEADPDLARRLAAEGPEALLAAASFRGELEVFLGRFGCRSRARSLTVPRWEEAPGEVAALVAGLVGRDPGSDPGARAGRRRAAREAWRRLPLHRRLLLRPLQRLARRFLDLREELRFHLDGALFLLRRALLALGEATGMGERVLYLTPGELAELVEGGADGAAAAALAERRRRELESAPPAPSFYVEGRAVERPGSDRADLLRGLGTSPGRAAGRARLVADPTAVDLAPGDVLVAVHADPGWTPVLARVAGVVLEEGGLLNHCSIVARELGIPAVVGVRGATRRIAEGAAVTLDGGEGWVLLGAGREDA
jgi:rifampicin phosphotransferase